MMRENGMASRAPFVDVVGEINKKGIKTFAFSFSLNCWHLMKRIIYQLHFTHSFYRHSRLPKMFVFFVSGKYPLLRGPQHKRIIWK